MVIIPTGTGLQYEAQNKLEDAASRRCTGGLDCGFIAWQYNPRDCGQTINRAPCSGNCSIYRSQDTNGRHILCRSTDGRLRLETDGYAGQTTRVVENNKATSMLIAVACRFFSTAGRDNTR
jgi:hypothetical protein